MVYRTTLVILASTALLFAISCTEKATLPQPQDSTPEDRARWNHERLKDPETGEIPFHMTAKEANFARPLFEWKKTSRANGDDLYKHIGPGNVGGRIRAAAYDVTDNNIIITGSVSGRVYKSTNSGFTWKTTDQLDAIFGITCIAQDRRTGKEKTWYYGTGEGPGNSQGAHGSATFYGNGIYKSTDNGDSWNLLSSTHNGNPNAFDYFDYVYRIVVDHNIDTADVVFAAIAGQIVRSTDGGSSWTTVLGANSGTFQEQMHTDIAISNSGVFYATLPSNSGQRGIYRSTDGISWANITPGNLIGSYTRIVLDISKSNENIAYFLANTPGNGTPAEPANNNNNEGNMLFKYTYISGDGTGSGGQWTDLTNNLPSNNNAYLTFDSQRAYNMVVKIDPFDENVVLIGGTNLFRSKDGFSSKANTRQIGGYNTGASNRFSYRYPNHHPDIHTLVFKPNQGFSRMLSGDDGGLHYTTDFLKDSVEWEHMDGIVGGQFYTVAVNREIISNVVVGGLQDNGTQWTNSLNISLPWKSPNLGDGSFCAVDPSTGINGAGDYYFSSQYGTLVKTKVDGNGEVVSFRRFEHPNYNYSFINPFELNNVDPNVLYMAAGSEGKVLRHSGVRSLVLDNSYQQRSSGWQEIASNLAGDITAMKSTFFNPSHRLYVGTGSSKVYRIDDAKANNPTITDISDFDEYRKGRYVSDIAVNPNNGDELMVVFSNYNVYSIYHSLDAGITWKGVSGNLEDPLPTGAPESVLGTGEGPSVRCAEIIPIDGGVVYLVGTSVGLFATDTLMNHNTFWTPQAVDDIGINIVEDLDFRRIDKFVAVATHGNGVFAGKIESIDQVLGEKAKPQKSEIISSFKCFPNPSSGDFTLQLGQQSDTHGNVTVYDMMGSELHQTEISEGQRNVKMQLPKSARGVYLIHVRVGEFESSQRIWVN